MTVEETKLDDEILVADEPDESEVYVAYDIATYPSDLTLKVVQDMWNAGEIVVPDFQRNYVWSIKQASLLIESFLMGLPVPQVFFYVDDDNLNQVIDGQQRIISIIYFLEGYFGTESSQGKKQVFRLQGLSEDNPFAKKRYEDLSDVHQRKLKSSVLRAINIRQLKPAHETTSVYHIFERLNTGGTPLKPQEIRNCVFRGELVRILRALNGNENWRAIIGKSVPDRHQKDVELILRIFALSYSFTEYGKPMKEFLNRIMQREKEGNSPDVRSFQSSFLRASETIASILGPMPFHIRGPLNASALDAVFATIINGLDHIPADLNKRYARLIEDKEFIDTTFYSTSDLSVVKRRFSVANNYLLG